MKIMIVDEHVLFRQGLQNLLSRELGFDIIGVAATGREAVDKSLDLRPDVVLMENWLPDGSSVATMREIIAHRPDCKVVILATHDTDENLFVALRSGAQGFILKDTPVSQLVAALKGLERGQLALPRSMAKRVINEFTRLGSESPSESGVLDQLSRREIEVLRHVGSGANNGEIAEQIAISEHTVKVHVRNIQKKLSLQNRAQVASYARRYGL
jgi:DNA-binding NarL/FixJ family response regulator